MTGYRLLPRTRMRKAGGALLAGALLTLPATAVGADTVGFTEAIDVGLDGQSTFDTGNALSISTDGRYVAFASDSPDLVRGEEDDIRDFDVFVRDRVTGTTERVSVTSSGKPADNEEFSRVPSISADGRFVAFSSTAANLDGGDKGDDNDVFVHDRLTGETTRVSVASDGSDANGVGPAISGDGRYVAFTSTSPALGVDDAAQLFVHDRETGLTELVSRAPDGSPANALAGGARMSLDGQFVAFSSRATNLAPGPDAEGLDVFLVHRETGTVQALTSGIDPDQTTQVHGIAEGISATGRYVTFTTEGDGFIEPPDGVFEKNAWLVDTQTNPLTYTQVSLNDAGERADGDSVAGPVSADGRFVAFESRSTNLDEPLCCGFHIYLRDVVAGTTRTVSVASDGGRFPSDTTDPAMTPDAQVIGFVTRREAAFVRDLRPTADVSVTMADAPDPVLERAQVTYTITAHNLGTIAATNTTVVDTLPADPTFVSATTGDGTCARDASSNSGGVLTCVLGTLDAGEQATVTLVLEPRAEGTIGNTATVHADQPDPDRTNNNAGQATTVMPR